MTLVSNLLVTGILAIVVGLAVAVWSVRFATRSGGWGDARALSSRDALVPHLAVTGSLTIVALLAVLLWAWPP